jgi:hypothetical protein
MRARVTHSAAVFAPQLPSRNNLLLYPPGSPGSADYRTNVMPTAGRSIFVRSEYSTYDKGIKTGTTSSWSGALV